MSVAFFNFKEYVDLFLQGIYDNHTEEQYHNFGEATINYLMSGEFGKDPESGEDNLSDQEKNDLIELKYGDLSLTNLNNYKQYLIENGYATKDEINNFLQTLITNSEGGRRRKARKTKRSKASRKTKKVKKGKKTKKTRKH